MKPVTKLKYTVIFDSIEPLGLFTNVFTFIWGLWLLLPFHTFENSRSFHMLGFIPEYIYGVLLCILSIIAITSAMKEKRPALADLVIFIWWLTIAVLITDYQWRSTGVPVYWTLVMIYGFLTVRRSYET